ncbi:MAG: hypothetical protein FD139_756 [Methylocystaceae bacterium]|nr:MAG: hypothetical protein FD148_72 [Methylocystaceae bacterium]KAF0214007.1 MAG: hypothetical protein FD172_131 [Methylocystaceae bacterium]TXT46911.1 MAG: hypothetical protein FD139_756 [Methylocystaceae bacterium]
MTKVEVRQNIYVLAPLSEIHQGMTDVPDRVE